MDLILFYANGQTFRFSQVTNLKVEGDKVEFDYYDYPLKRIVMQVSVV